MTVKLENPIDLEYNKLQQAIEQLKELIRDQMESIDELSRQIAHGQSTISECENSVTQLSETIVEHKKELAKRDLLFAPEYASLLAYYQNVVNSPMTYEAKEITAIIRDRKYKGIVVYPHAVHWEPMQRPQQLLIEFARKGYLCFFCDYSDQYSMREEIKNLFVITNQDHLLQALQTSHVLVLNSYLLQNAWIDNLPHKTIWYDVLDRIDFFSYYDRNMLAKHFEVLGQADLITYSAKNLLDYVKYRPDSIYLPNAVRPEDFNRIESEPPIIPEDLNEIVKPGKKVIGYFGAIEEWFDTDLVKTLADAANVEIILIGHCGISDKEFPENVHFLGSKPYFELGTYTPFFDALIIPFKITTLTQAVSPVKFFEYCAIGKPILSTSLAEIMPFEGPGITIVEPGKGITLDERFWNLNDEGRRHLASIANKHQWSKRSQRIERELQDRLSCLPIYANRKTFKYEVSVFTATFLDFEGENYYSGGAERYLVDLHDACRELGLKLNIFQYGHFAWHRKYKDIDVYSLGHEDLNMYEFSKTNLDAFNQRFLYSVEGKSILNFYSAFFQAFPNVSHPSIGISHGVAWDHPGCDFDNPQHFWSDQERFLASAKMLQKMVSVDTNTPNWFQTIHHSIGQKMQTIPNYVDPNEFYPVEKKENGKIRIVYPRRLYEARGLYLTLSVVDSILKKYPNTEFHFVGKGFEEDVAKVQEAMEKWPGRIYCYHKVPEDMHQVYKEADIVLIPTLYSEGTSLSCLEACASGNTVIATRVGGLTDIIIDRFNGLLINPDARSLEQALITCLENPDVRKQLGRNALEVSKAFDKFTWKQRWKSVIMDMLKQNKVLPKNQRPVKSPESIEFRLTPQTKRTKWMPEALKFLSEGKTVYIRGCKDATPEQSFGRLQWVADDAVFYFNPEIRQYD